MIRDQLALLTKNAIQAAQAAGELPAFDIPEIPIDRPQRPELGDYSSPVAMKLASAARRAPLQIAQAIARRLAADPAISKVETVAPGFINFRLSAEWLQGQVRQILAAGSAYGNLTVGAGQRVQVEHISANPTGPLTVGSARNAAIGDTLVRILQAAGYQVETEYYINDAGSQIRHFGASVYARYAQAAGRDEPFPEDGYKGEYVEQIGRELLSQYGPKYLDLPRDEALRALGRLGIDKMLELIRATTARLRVHMDSWFSERSLYERGLFDQVLKILQDRDLIHTSQGATWFTATRLGLEKDAVLIRSPEVIPEPSERPTYLASDVAYVWNKLVERGFARAIYVWGADHHGDLPRVLAAARALGLDDKRLNILLYQLVVLKRGGELVRMSKRAGDFVTLDELLDEIGADAVRFLLITRSADSMMELDLQLAKEQSLENPVYYVQYSHARIASILRHAAEVGLSGEGGNVALLVHPAELDLIRVMTRFEEVVKLAAERLEPHHLPPYVMELASVFNAFYRDCRVVSSDPADAEISRARLVLAAAAKQVLARALDLMGVSAPESM
ncbi:MAG: arginine--tRNA ligase [Anaerolineae bacterium]